MGEKWPQWPQTMSTNRLIRYFWFKRYKFIYNQWYNIIVNSIIRIFVRFFFCVDLFSYRARLSPYPIDILVTKFVMCRRLFPWDLLPMFFEKIQPECHKFLTWFKHQCDLSCFSYSFLRICIFILSNRSQFVYDLFLSILLLFFVHAPTFLYCFSF